MEVKKLATDILKAELRENRSAKVAILNIRFYQRILSEYNCNSYPFHPLIFSDENDGELLFDSVRLFPTDNLSTDFLII